MFFLLLNHNQKENTIRTMVKILDKYKPFFIALIGLEIALLFLGVYDFMTEELGSIWDIYKYLLIPSIILAFFSTFYLHFLVPKYRIIFRGIDRSLKNRFKLSLRLLITTPGMILVLFVGIKGTIGFVNRTFGVHEPLVLNGQVDNKHISRNKYGKNFYYYEFYSKELDEIVSFSISENSYNKINEGDFCQEKVMQGSLGIWYKIK